MKEDLKAITIVGSMFLLALSYGYYKHLKIDKTGVFVVAKIINFEKGQKPSANCYYNFLGKQILSRFGSLTSGLKEDQLIFIKVSSKDPESINALDYYKIKVPSCFDINSTPFEGWKEIPKDTCPTRASDN
jgi:hypothetical protein